MIVTLEFSITQLTSLFALLGVWCSVIGNQKDLNKVPPFSAFLFSSGMATEIDPQKRRLLWTVPQLL